VPVDALVLAFFAAGAVILALVAGQSLARGRALDSIADLADHDDADDLEAVTTAVQRLARRAADALLQLEHERGDLAYLANLIGVGIVRLSDDLNVEFANAAAHHFLGREPGWMVGRTALEAFGDHAVEAVVLAARDGPATTAEVQPRGPDGPTLVVRARRSPILGLWLVLEDVAELRRLQRIRSEFIDNLSHELRTPITTVGLLAETLERDAEAAGDALPARMRDRIAKLRVESGNIGQMVDELLDLRRIESGETPLLLDDVDLGAVATDAVERLRPFAERQGVRLTLDIPPIMARVRGDGSRLGQVFTNLLHNAVKFSLDGGEVAVSVRSTGDGRLEASVTDHGIGIARSDLPRIFERFYKADRARVRGGGTGLGLAITRHIVEGHGGRIRAESELGIGSTFTMTLPAAALHESTTEARWTA
jgi:two-component system phosphate regulon sensor histidine kinase PhoR